MRVRSGGTCCRWGGKSADALGLILHQDISEQFALRLHTQLFTGYGDSLVDYNRRRTVLSIGLTLVDW